jgi:hypothetical protein
VATLAERVGASTRQIRTAVRALERRELVVITKEYIGWSGRGEYGRLADKYWRGAEDLPTAKVVTTGHDFDDEDGHWYPIKREFGHIGMPRAGLLVWTPENRLAWLQHHSEFLRAAFGAKPGPEELAEYTRLQKRSPSSP